MSQIQSAVAFAANIVVITTAAGTVIIIVWNRFIKYLRWKINHKDDE